MSKEYWADLGGHVDGGIPLTDVLATLRLLRERKFDLSIYYKSDISWIGASIVEDDILVELTRQTM